MAVGDNIPEPDTAQLERDNFVSPHGNRPSGDISNSILCGAVAGIAAKTAIAPIERLKMRFQVSSERFSWRKFALRGKEVLKREGLFSLWKGHSTTILRVAPYSGFSYAFHDLSENLFKSMLQVDRLPAFYKFLAGSIGGFGGTLLTYPLDVLRVRLALGVSWKSSLQQGGFFQGLSPTLLGIIPYAGTSWLTKQTLLEHFPTIAHRKPSVLESIGINAIAG